MNLLAHAVLSGETPGVVVGGILADWIKGPLENNLPRTIIEGIRRHRRVDILTDAHPVAAISRKRLIMRWGKYSGILVDMAYDFCLAATWDRFGSGSLDEFVLEVHGMLDQFIPSLPTTAAEVARRMIADRWMFACKSWEGIGLALERLSRRLRRPVALGEAATDLKQLEPDLVADFLRLFPDIAAQVSDEGIPS